MSNPGRACSGSSEERGNGRIRARDPAWQNLLHGLESQGAFRNGTLDPVLAELAADRQIRQAGVDLLFQGRVIGCRRVSEGFDQVQVACKGARTVLQTRTGIFLSGCETTDIHDNRGYSLWSVKFAHCMAKPGQMELTLAGQAVPIRIRPTGWENECAVDIAIPRFRYPDKDPEDVMGMVYEAVVQQLKRAVPGLSSAAPVYLSDESWQWCGGANDEFSWESCGSGLIGLVRTGEGKAIEALARLRKDKTPSDLG